MATGFFFSSHFWNTLQSLEAKELGGGISMAAVASEILRRSLAESVKIADGSGSGELHVLAVDDSLVDRKVIERLLKISSCKGEILPMILSFFSEENNI